MKVSIIIPVYNVSAYIERCIISVMHQTYTGEMECLIVDDCGSDDSIAIAERTIAQYKGSIRFRILHHSKNRGLSAARNTGTDAATGDYIFYLDSDDTITNDCIEKMVTPIIRDNTIDMVMGHYEKITDNKPSSEICSKLFDCKDINGWEAIRDSYFERNEITVCAINKLTRKDFLIHFGITFKEGLLFEDWLWVFHLMKHLNHLYIIPNITYLYYVRPESIITGTRIKTKQIHWGIIFHEISTNLTPEDSDREARYYVVNLGFTGGYIDCYNNELWKKAARNFRKGLSFKRYPNTYLRLLMINILSNTWIGLQTLRGLRAMSRALRELRAKGKEELPCGLQQ